jgi:LysR family glycine cleavage system transcriptional activator
VSAPFRNLPSLQALRCFEAAARLGSFALAANELCITHSAISHQIRALEESTGKLLFDRVGNRMTLTVIGRALAVETRRALDYLSRAYAVANEADIRKGGTLTLAIQLAIAEHWLLPRLDQLRRVLGEADLRIVSLNDLVETFPEDVDAAIVYGTGDIPNMVVEKIADEEVFPVCSRGFLGHNSKPSLERIERGPLLLHSRATWNLWLEQAHLPIEYSRNAIAFDDIALTIGAALAGHGIAMARSLLVRDYLQSGELVKMFDLAVPGIFNYYVAWRSDRTMHRFSVLRNWLFQALPSSPKRLHGEAIAGAPQGRRRNKSPMRVK